MLSILIPTKDYDCHLLVEQLHKQGEKSGLDFEILVGEDGTSPQALHLNIIADTLPNSRRIIREKNIGRANIRNILAIEAKYPNILFIDSDAVVEKDNFLSSYCQALEKHDVVCGGLYHKSVQPDNSCSLRFRYEKEADKRRSATTRSKAPYDNFTTFNFAIKRDMFLSILFYDKIEHYGYEDTLFGKELQKRGANIVHIDNALLHNGLESNSIYLSKVEQSLHTLKTITAEIGSTPLLDCANRLRNRHLAKAYSLVWKIARRAMRSNLIGKHPSLTIFKLYKLGYFLSLDK